MELGGAPPTRLSRRQRLGELGLFVACLLVVVAGLGGVLWLVARMMLSLSEAARP